MDTNPYILGLTVIVSIVHSVFEFLAFKNGEEVECIHVHAPVCMEWEGVHDDRLMASGYPEE